MPPKVLSRWPKAPPQAAAKSASTPVKSAAKKVAYEKMLWMLDQDSDTLVPLLMNKLAST
jgi:hypothetical protein